MYVLHTYYVCTMYVVTYVMVVGPFVLDSTDHKKILLPFRFRFVLKLDWADAASYGSRDSIRWSLSKLATITSTQKHSGMTKWPSPENTHCKGFLGFGPDFQGGSDRWSLEGYASGAGHLGGWGYGPAVYRFSCRCPHWSHAWSKVMMFWIYPTKEIKRSLQMIL